MSLPTAITQLLVVCAVTLVAAPSDAQLKFYYDPGTGNVAFDTAEVPSAGLWGLGMWVNPDITGFSFLPENFVGLTQSSFEISRDDHISDASLSTTFGGYLTLGNILPTGLSESEWAALDEWVYDYTNRERNALPGYWFASYRDSDNRNQNVEHADFVYGQPDREFDNRWDLVDPDQLDWAESATLVYNPLTGGVTIDTQTGEEGGHITMFTLQSEGAFLPENFTPWIDAPFTSATNDLIGFAADAIEPGLYDAGAILPAGLTLEGVQSAITSARFLGRAGFAGGSFDIETDGVDFQIAMATALPGDFNLDGQVDLADLDILGRNFGQPGGPRDGDANGDGQVDLIDLEVLSKPVFPYGVPRAQAVPEPTALLLAVIASVGMSRRKLA